MNTQLTKQDISNDSLFIVETEDRLEMVQISSELANSVCVDDTTIKASAN
jgi:hypothetical protein